MPPRKNLFVIGRSRQVGSENQLTEMLAYLFQEESELAAEWLTGLGLPVEGVAGWEAETQRAVPGGFCDLVLTAPGEAIVIVESKLGSTTTYAQIAKYMQYLNALPSARAKALVFATKQHEALPQGVAAEAPEVLLKACRWQELAGFMRGSESRLAQDFVEMLEKEGIVAPEPISDLDWETWRNGSAVARRLRGMLDEVSESISRLDDGFVKAGPSSLLSNGMVRRLFEFEHFVLWLAFWPSRQPQRPEDHSFVNVYVADTSRPREERRAAAHNAAELAAEKAIEFVSDWDEYALVHIQPAHEVLTAAEYSDQRNQLVAHAAAVLRRLAEIGYLQHPAPQL